MLMIRDEEGSDAPAIRGLLEAAFGSTVEATIVDTVRLTCDDRVSLVALEDDRVVGHILFTPVTIDTGTGRIEGYGLGPMAVLPQFQRMGIGSALVRAGLERLRQSQRPFVVVVGHPGYYPRFGFVRASTYDVRCEWNEVPDEAFMIMVLKRSIEPRLTGLARYPSEFGEAV
jgi:putative acetyltransferase